jgi:uncharacterized membrane protein YeaQ/YmgE (transglycosylase-associated protein family)
MSAAQGTLVSSSNIRIYYYFILGAFGGLTGWLAMALSSSGPTPNYFLRGAFLGALTGCGIGIYDGLASRSFARTVKFGGMSLLLGLVAGALAMPIVENIYRVMSGSGSASVAAGVLCWILFGGIIGWGEGFSKGSQNWKGLLGGMAGGFIGGGLYEALGRRQDAANASEQTLLALAFLLLGGAIGAAIALVTNALKSAWLSVENGKLAGKDIDISKYVNPALGSRKAGIIGCSQWDSTIYLPGDSDVLPRHASISYKDGSPTFTTLPEARAQGAETRVNNRVVTEWPLRNGDRIQIGSTNLVYRHKR